MQSMVLQPLKLRCLLASLGQQKNESGKKKEQKPKLSGPDIFRWRGGLPREGVGSKKPLETHRKQSFWWDVLGFLLGNPGVSLEI